MAAQTTGPAPLTRAELAFRDKVRAKLKQWRSDLHLTQEQLGVKIDPANTNPKAYVYRVESNEGGNYSAWGLMQHCHALGHTLAELLVECGAERVDVAWVEDPTEAAIEADTHLSQQAKRLLIVQVKQGHADYHTESASKLRAAERRDLARQVGIDDAVLNAWVRLDAEQRRRAAEHITNTAAENETTPAPRGRRRKKD